MTDTLHITSLQTSTKIGVHDWEQNILQPLLLDITIPVNVNDCGEKLNNTIDYTQLSHVVLEHVESNSFALIETVAITVAELIKKTFHVNNVTVSVSKPFAVKEAKNVTITVHR